jgi:hypothetical protein
MLSTALIAASAALCIGGTAAAEPPGAPQPGDDALTCTQIYAQGMAESQREQDERRAKMGPKQSGISMFLEAAATNGGSVIEHDRKMVDAATAPPNPRKERLRQLWTEKRCEAPGAKPADGAMSCEQIAAELAPYGRQIAPNVQALLGTQQQLMEQGRSIQQKRMAEHAALESMATAGAVDPTGISKRANMAAEMAQMAKERAENEAFANSPLAQQNKAQTAQLAAQAQDMQSNARIQHLMQLAQQQHCDRR